MKTSIRVVVLGRKTNNLINFSESFDNPYWLKSGTLIPVVSSNVAASPIGTIAADSVVFRPSDESAFSIISVDSGAIESGQQYTSSFWVKANNPNDVNKIILHRHVGRANYMPILLTTEWQQIIRTETAFSDTLSFTLGSRPSFGSSSGEISVLLWGAQLEIGSVASNYRATGI